MLKLLVYIVTMGIILFAFFFVIDDFRYANYVLGFLIGILVPLEVAMLIDKILD